MLACLKYIRPFIWLFIAFLCTGTLFYYTFKSAINVPFIDDYNGLIDFIIQYAKAESIQKKIHFIFRQHNEHRIAFARLIVLLNYYISNSISFRHLALLGSINLIIIAGIFSIEAYKVRKNLLAIVPVILLTFNFQHINNLLWTTSSLQNIGVIALACLTIWLLTKENTFFQFSGLVFAFLTNFSSGSGPVIWLVVLLIAVAKGNITKCFIALLISICSLFLYFHNYHITLTSNTSLTEKFFNLPEVIFGVIGGTFDIQEKENYLWPVLAGFILTAIFSCCLWRMGISNLRKNPAMLFLLGAFAFGFLLAMTIGVGRSSYIENRYKIVSTLCLLATYNSVLVYSTYRENIVRINFINAVCLGLWLLFFWSYYPEMLAYNYARRAEYLSIVNNPSKAQSSFQYRFNNLDELGINSLDDSLIQETFVTSTLKKDLILPQLKISEVNNKYTVTWKEDSFNDSESYLVFKSGNGSAVFPVRNVTNDVITFVRHKGQFYSGIKQVSIFFDWLPKGSYNACVYFPGKKTMVPIQNNLVIDKNAPQWLSFRWFNDNNAL
ncbi:hypothetical protein FEM33_05980 [Dyadobacter flavalbus]|uniref:Glycosyltransferase RgtA/B/C/D-like domain-containing protein n=1 Tax=Dyadobacter flavalbus TaxID=2579942 RepID=A0A5M8QV31_9BACT|nr:hypothetical protein [Dyadobacter flavalbus]KAA6440155.1 hypothetical protein FEM33_05980 [Dyadobacter flavalbus]